MSYKYVNLLGVILLAVVLAACGRDTSTVETNELASYSYVLDGKTTTVEELKRLEGQNARLFYLVAPDIFGLTVQVFTDKSQFEQAQQGTFNRESLCISTRSKTKIYDLTNYNGYTYEVSKGVNISDLGTIARGGNTWNDSISSFKAAHCTWTYFYTDTNFQGNPWAVKGSTASVMLPFWDNAVSSMEVLP